MQPARLADLVRLAPVALLLGGAALYPAFLNGFPLVFSDSGVYIGTYRYPGVPPFHTLFVWITSLRAALWLTLAAQAAITGLTLAIFLRAAGVLANRLAIAGAGLAVLLLNQLPWLTSWIMPDFLAGLGIAALCLLLLLPERLTWLEAGFLTGVLLLASLSASANLPLYAGLLVVSLASQGIVRRRWPPLAGTLAALGTLVLAACLALAANLALHGRAELNSGGPVLTFSRLADTGIAQPYVSKRCKTATFAICEHQSWLADYVPGGQTFLWDGLADATDARGANREEYAQLVSEIVRAAWPAILRQGLADSLILFARPVLTIEGAFGELSPRESGAGPGNAIAARYPHLVAGFASARQQQGTLEALFPSKFFAVSTYAGYAAVLLLGLAAWRRGDGAGVCLALAMTAAVIGELVLHGMLVGAYHRYHVKVAWLGWLFAAALAARLLADRRGRSETGHDKNGTLNTAFRGATG